MDLTKIREELDKIDRQLVELYETRMKTCADVAEYKIDSGKAVLDIDRERQKIASVRDMVNGEFNKEAIEELYKQIMTISRRYQYMLMGEKGVTTDSGYTSVTELPHKDSAKVVYQGVEGAYSHIATLGYFGKDADAYHVERFEDAMASVTSGKAEYGVIPIENSSAGSVTDTYDLLLKYDVSIVAEYMLPVSHALLALPGTKMEDITTVYSHPQGLMQCAAFLSEHKNIKQVSMANTAVAAKKVKEDADKSQAAIASCKAGELYGLDIIEEGINRNCDNTTRFIIISKEHIYTRKADKISMMFELKHESGALYNILGNFIFNHINMIKIESRPIPEKKWEYRFFVDIEGRLDTPEVTCALNGMASECSNLKILGNY